ncbi:hypothetical protein SDC9_122676 [bioreactor metagenome]|uniref:Uncharacterized protein n=1 Tax=bioreactor metagenome TaxID=1076179 RepID=A0A645CFQ6_9ZZZZ
MSGAPAVSCSDRPVVVRIGRDLVRPEIQHRLDAEHHPRNQQRAAPEADEIRHFRRLVEPKPATVADIFADHAETVLLRHRLHRPADILHMVSAPRLFDSGHQRLFRSVQQPPEVRRQFPEPEGQRRVAHAAVQLDADVDADDVGVKQNPIHRSDAVNHLVVDRDADVAGVSAVAEKRALAARRANQLPRHLVKIEGGHSGPDLRGDFVAHPRRDLRRAADPDDFFGRMNVLIARHDYASSAVSSAWTLSLSSPVISNSSPRLR